MNKFVQFHPKIHLFGQNSTNFVTYNVRPLAKDKIMVRFENLADRFDPKSTSIKYLDVQNFAKEFFQEANPFADFVPQIDVTEVSLGDNFLMKDLKKKLSEEKFPWRGDDDARIKPTAVYKSPEDKENGMTGAALPPQRIRQYVIEYNKNLKAEPHKVAAKGKEDQAPKKFVQKDGLKTRIKGLNVK